MQAYAFIITFAAAFVELFVVQDAEKESISESVADNSDCEDDELNSTCELPASEKLREQGEKQQDFVNNQQQLSINTPDTIQTCKPKVHQRKCNEETTFLQTASKYMNEATMKKNAIATSCGTDDAFINYYKHSCQPLQM